MTPEAKVRNPVVQWAKLQGIGHIRMSFRPGVTSGWPDDLFLLPGGKAYFIEFKRPGKEPTPLQWSKLEKARELGFAADWFDDSDKACRSLASAMGAAPVHAQSSGAPGGPWIRRARLRSWLEEDEHHARSVPPAEGTWACPNHAGRCPASRAKWTNFRELRFSLLHGPKKAERLKDTADIWLINPEGVVWLAKQFMGRSLPFDVVTIDELTKFKNARSERSKALRPRLSGVARRWALTGSLIPNGMMDLFGEQLMIDDGAALGKYITHFRDTYFQRDYNGFDYTLQPGAEKRIIERIAPYWLQMSADDYMQLPALIQDIRVIEMEPEARATYTKMKNDMIAALPEGVVTAANAAAVFSKLSQMANGCVYVAADRSTASVIHDAKLDALEEIVEELNGQPLLVAYEYNHDIIRLRARFGDDLPHLGKGTTVAQEAEYIAAWNRNELPILACHPASAGHGLNLQEGNAAHVCWFSPTWDLELYDQFIRRIRRSGNQAQRIFNHILAVRDTIDELKLEALKDKDTTQTRLLKALNTEILRDTTEETNMAITKLTRPGTPAAPAAAPEAEKQVSPKGWGAPAKAEATDNGQRDRIAEKLRGNNGGEQYDPQMSGSPQYEQQVHGNFSGDIAGRKAALEKVTQEDAPAPAKRTRRTQAEMAMERATTQPEAVTTDATANMRHEDAVVEARYQAIIEARLTILHLVFANKEAFEPSSMEEGLEIAGQLRAWVES